MADFDYFDGSNIGDVICDVNKDYEEMRDDAGEIIPVQIVPGEGGVTYDNMCDEDGSFRFTGCEKRQCTIRDSANPDSDVIDQNIIITDNQGNTLTTVDYGSIVNVKCNVNYHLEEAQRGGGRYGGDTWEDVDTGSKEIICGDNDNFLNNLQSLRCSENKCKFPYNKIVNNYAFEPSYMGSKERLRDWDNRYTIGGLRNELNKVKCQRDYYELLKKIMIRGQMLWK